MRFFSTTLLLIIFSWVLQAQDKDFFAKYNDSLFQIQNKLFAAKTDHAKEVINNFFLEVFERALTQKSSFNFDFDSLSQIARLQSDDKKIKIYNWNLVFDDGTHRYYGFIQSYNKKKKSVDLFKLQDKSDELKNIDNATCTAEKWLGVLYYKIITKRIKKKTYYTLLAWDGNDNVTTKKIIEVLYFDEKGTPKFGENIFKYEKKSPKRVVFEYSSQAVMSVKYNEKQDMIIFDHLAPQNENLKGFAQFYVPDFSYDAFQYKKGKWIYVADVDARNDKKENDNFYNDPKSNQAPKKRTK